MQNPEQYTIIQMLLLEVGAALMEPEAGSKVKLLKLQGAIDSMSAFASYLTDPDCTLVALHLFGCRFNVRGMRELADILQDNRSVVALNVTQDEITQEGAAALADMLQVNSHIVALDHNAHVGAGHDCEAEFLRAENELKWNFVQHKVKRIRNSLRLAAAVMMNRKSVPSGVIERIIAIAFPPGKDLKARKALLEIPPGEVYMYDDLRKEYENDALRNSLLRMFVEPESALSLTADAVQTAFIFALFVD